MIVEYSTLQALLEALSESRKQTISYFDLADEQLQKQYAPGKWSIRELLQHLVDAETVLYERLRRTIANPGQVIWAFDQDKWAEELSYHTIPLSLNRPIYESVRESIIYLAETYYDSHGHHSFVHSHTGSRTLKDEFDKVAWHNIHHLSQMQQALNT